MKANGQKYDFVDKTLLYVQRASTGTGGTINSGVYTVRLGSDVPSLPAWRGLWLCAVPGCAEKLCLFMDGQRPGRIKFAGWSWF